MTQRYCLAFTVLVSLSLGGWLVGCRREPAAPPPAPSESPFVLTAEMERQLRVDPGDEDTAFDYYKETFDELGLNPEKLDGQKLVDAQNLGVALAFLGYGGVKAADLENVPSADLMRRFPDRVLSCFFFAPKIVDVSVTPVNLGWRKVIRIRPQPGSAAEKLGVESAYLLFNKFQGKGDYVTDPQKPRDDLSNESKNTQLILTRTEASELKRPVYFFVYGPISGGGKLITFLTASFDARDPLIAPGNKYFVPNACAECHGGKIISEDDWKKIKLNYLDSDHWFDRLDDDFPMLKDSPHGVLYDGGKDQSTQQFKDAFAVLRRLNAEIEQQVTRVEPNPAKPSFQLYAVRKWNALHATETGHQNIFARALENNNGKPMWKGDASPDQSLLPLLNRYCFRCHSSLKYSVFDRDAVVSRKSRIVNFIQRKTPGDKFKMPQDRELDQATIDQLVKLVNDLK